MNAKEARNIIDLWNSVPPKEAIERQARLVFLCKAQGYLEALKGPEVLALLDALRKVVFRDEDDAGICEKALAQYQKAVGSEVVKGEKE